MAWSEEETAAVAADLSEVIELALELAAARCPAELSTQGMVNGEAAMILREVLFGGCAEEECDGLQG